MLPIFLKEKLRSFGASRSPKWSKLRNNIVKEKQYCAVCGKTENVTVHHIKPFHEFPELELDPNNLIILCESKTMNCHLVWGHFNNYQNSNPNIKEDAIILNTILKRNAVITTISEQITS